MGTIWICGTRHVVSTFRSAAHCQTVQFESYSRTVRNVGAFPCCSKQQAANERTSERTHERRRQQTRERTRKRTRNEPNPTASTASRSDVACSLALEHCQSEISFSWNWNWVESRCRLPLAACTALVRRPHERERVCVCVYVRPVAQLCGIYYYNLERVRYKCI